MIYVTSDLHYKLSEQGDRATEQLARDLAETGRPEDVFLLGGDLGNDDEDVRACLALFDAFPGAKLAVAGNHDIWIRNGSSSWERFERVTSLFAECGFHALDIAPAIVGDTAFVGTIGWYDYSFRDAIGIPDVCYERKELDSGLRYMDAEYVRWGLSDPDMTDVFAGTLSEHLGAVRAKKPRQTVALLHHVPAKRLLMHPRAFVPTNWRFMNAFLGSDRFGEFLVSNDVDLVFCGHIHRGKSFELAGTHFQSVGSTYDQKELLSYDGVRVHSRVY